LDEMGNGAPDGAGLLVGRGAWLLTDPCTKAEHAVPAEVEVGPSVDDFADALADHPLLDVTDPVDVTLAGYAGKYVELQVPADISMCEVYRPFDPGIFAQGPSHQWHLWILDVDGLRFVVQSTDYPGTSAKHRAELDAIVDSIRIDTGATPEVIGERLAAGTHTARPFDPALPEPWGVCVGQPGCSETPADDSISITYTVPEGWAFGFRAAVTKPSAGTVAPSGMSLHFLRGGWLFTDPCLKIDTLPDIEVGPTADDFADALAAHPLLDVTTPVDVTLGGFSGKYLDLLVPADISACRESYFPWAPAFYAQGPSHRWHIWSLDIDGVRVVIQSGDFAGTLPENLAEMHAIIDSIRIEP
jgi:hypothetical protein